MNPLTIDDNTIDEDTSIIMLEDILTLCPSHVRWEVQVRDYVENILLGLPSARLSEQHSLSIVDDDKSSWTKSHLCSGG
jgi:hypothetical protein